MDRTQIDELSVIIKANADQFRKELATVQKQMIDLKKNTGSVSKAIGSKSGFMGSMMIAQIGVGLLTGALRLLQRAFSSILRVITRFIGESVEAGFVYQRMSVATETIARNLGISAEQLNKWRDALADSNTYGIEAEEVIRKLLLSGLHDLANGLSIVDARTGEVGEGLTGLIITMKDLSAAAGIDSADGIEALTDFLQGQQNQAWRNLLQIGNLNQAYREFGDSIGKSTQELTQQERAQARLNVMLKEGQKVFGAYANTYETSGKAMGSFRDLMKNIKALLGRGLEPILATVANAFVQIGNAIRNFLIAYEPQIRAWASRVAGSILGVIRVIGMLLSMLPKIGPFFKELTNFKMKPLQPVVGSAGDVEEAFEGASDGAKDLKKELQGLAGFDEMNILKQPDKDSGGAGSDVGGLAGLGGLGDALDIPDFSADINEQMESVMNKFREWYDELKRIYDKYIYPYLVKPLKEFFGMIYLVWKKWIEPIWKDFKESIGITGDGFGALEIVALAVLWVIWLALFPIIATIFLVTLGVLAVVAVLWLLGKAWEWTKETIIKVLGWVHEKIVWLANETVKWFGVIWAKVKEVFGNIRTWIADRVESARAYVLGRIRLILGYFSSILGRVRYVFTNIRNWIADRINNARGYVLGRINLILGYFSNVWGRVRSVFTNIRNWIADRINNARAYIFGRLNLVLGYFNRLRTRVSNIFSNIGVSISNTFTRIVNRLRSLINNFVISPLNNARLVINKGLGAIGVNIRAIPYLAQGGIVSSPTIAMIGERGKEAVIPLENNTEWIDMIAEKLGGSSGEQHLTVRIGDDTIFDKAIDYIKDKGVRTGSNILNL